jgi:hypothetical protein
MRAMTSFVRTGEDRTPSVFVPLPEARGRPPVRFRLKVSSPQDVEDARKARVPVYLLTPTVVTALGCPIEFPPELVVARSALSATDTPYRTIPFLSDRAVLRPRFEDVALALLSVNRLAARVVLERNRARLDPQYLMKRVLQEDLEAQATSVRLFDLVPALSRVGPSLPKAAIERQLRKNLPTGRLP